MAIKRAQLKTLKIDEHDVSGHEDETILQVALENGLCIPTLCALEGLSIVGACRLCLVEVEGWKKLVPACATLVEEGMVVHTSSARLDKYRRMILELVFSEGNHTCAVCVSNGHCELQNLAVRFGMEHVRFPNLNQRTNVDMTHPRYAVDQNRCVLCLRCVRVCDEIEGAHVWDVFGRGIQSHVISGLNQPWGDVDTCTRCGKCVNVCPTGTLSEKGWGVGEMMKQQDFLPYLTKLREARK